MTDLGYLGHFCAFGCALPSSAENLQSFAAYQSRITTAPTALLVQPVPWCVSNPRWFLLVALLFCPFSNLFGFHPSVLPSVLLLCSVLGPSLQEGHWSVSWFWLG